jgi:hypothetical protein
VPSGTSPPQALARSMRATSPLGCAISIDTAVQCLCGFRLCTHHVAVTSPHCSHLRGQKPWRPAQAGFSQIHRTRAYAPLQHSGATPPYCSYLRGLKRWRPAQAGSARFTAPLHMHRCCLQVPPAALCLESSCLASYHHSASAPLAVWYHLHARGHVGSARCCARSRFRQGPLRWTGAAPTCGACRWRICLRLQQGLHVWRQRVLAGDGTVM